MPISRTAWIDDDGSGTTGTPINNAEKTALYNQIDAALHDPGVTLNTQSGGINPMAIPAGKGNLTIFLSAPAPLTIYGLTQGLPGQQLTLYALGGSSNVNLLNNAVDASAGTKLALPVTSAPISMMNGGFATFVYDGPVVSNVWRLVNYQQGAWITPPYAAGDFTGGGGTWTVEAADVSYRQYCIQGTMLLTSFYIGGTSATAGMGSMVMKIPGGFTYAGGTYTMAMGKINDNGTMKVAEAYLGASATTITMRPVDGSTLAASTNASGCNFVLSFPVV